MFSVIIARPGSEARKFNSLDGDFDGSASARSAWNWLLSTIWSPEGRQGGNVCGGARLRRGKTLNLSSPRRPITRIYLQCLILNWSLEKFASVARSSPDLHSTMKAYFLIQNSYQMDWSTLNWNKSNWTHFWFDRRPSHFDHLSRTDRVSWPEKTSLTFFKVGFLSIFIL